MFIFFAILVINITFVSMHTIRMVFIFKGKRILAAIIGAVEAFIFILGIGLVMENMDAFHNFFAYAGGYAIGILVGVKLEEKLAIGYVTVKVVSKNIMFPLSQELRRKGFGVTSWLGEGRGGQRLVLEILTSRKDQRDLYNYILTFDPEAFIMSYEPQHFRGGFWVNNLRKYCKKNKKDLDHPFEDNLPGVDFEAIEEMHEAFESDTGQCAK